MKSRDTVGVDTPDTGLLSWAAPRWGVYCVMWWQGSTLHCTGSGVIKTVSPLHSIPILPMVSRGLMSPVNTSASQQHHPYHRSEATLLRSLCQPALRFIGIKNIGQTRSMLWKPWQKWLNLADLGKEMSWLETPLRLYISLASSSLTHPGQYVLKCW